MTAQQETNIIARAKDDPEAFGLLFEAYYERILGYAIRRTGQVAVAQDIASEVFYRALKHIQTYESRGVPFCAWLYKIATNEVNHYFRTRHLRPISLDMLLDEHGIEYPDATDVANELMDAEEKLERHEAFLRLQRFITTLPLKYQEVLALRYFEHKRVSDICDIVHKKMGTVKSLLTRGTEKLRVAIEADLERNPAPRTAMQPFSSPSVIKSEQSS